MWFVMSIVYFLQHSSLLSSSFTPSPPQDLARRVKERMQAAMDEKVEELEENIQQLEWGEGGLKKTIYRIKSATLPYPPLYAAGRPYLTRGTNLSCRRLRQWPR